MSESQYVYGNGNERPPTAPDDHLQSEAVQHSEGKIAKSIEQQTAKVPSDVFLWAAGASIVGSLALHVIGRKVESNFLGQWAPTILILGIYNKIVKVAGSDRTTA